MAWLEGLDTFIGLITIFLILSLIGTAIGEGVSTLTRLRGRVLHRLLFQLLGEAAFEEFLAREAIQRLRAPRIGLLGHRGRFPSYIPDATFASELVDLLVNPQPANAAAQAVALPVTVANIDRALAAGRHPKLCAVLRKLWQESDFDIGAFQAKIADWFNQTGDRSVGWFKRELNAYLFATGLVMAIGLNADTVHMFKSLSEDAELRQVFVERAGELVDSAGGQTGGSVVADWRLLCPAADDGSRDEEACIATAQAISAADGGEVEIDDDVSSFCGAPVATSDDIPAACRERADNLTATLGYCDAFGISRDECTRGAVVQQALPELLPVIGWEQIDGTPAGEKDGGFWASKILGWILTAAAVSLGAPFWFDLLQKLVRVRSTLKPRKSAEPQAQDSQQGEAPAVAAAPAARTLLRPRAAASASIASLMRFDTDRFGYSPLNLFWSSRMAALAYADDGLIAAELETWEAQGQLIEQPETDTQCLLVHTPKLAMLAFRGTEQKLEDWLTDFEIKHKQPSWDADAAFAVHTGFDKALDSIWPQLVESLQQAGVWDRGLPLWLTGHSLGGALAALSALRLPAHLLQIQTQSTIGALHTFGQPRVGDSACAAALDRAFPNRYFRSVNHRDVVPRIPLPRTPDVLSKVTGDSDLEIYDYVHAGRVIYFNDAGQALMDPPLWYRKLDAFAVGASSDAIKDALRQTTGDHAMTGYVALHKSLLDTAEQE